MKDEVVKAFSMMAALAAFLLGSAAAWADAAKPVLRAGLTLEVSTLDPVRATNYGENIIILNVYDMLVMPMPDNTVIPWIAKSWDVSDDRKSYTFHLRDDVLFHDGKPVEGEDIAFSMRRVLTLPGLVGGYLRNVDKDRIEVIDPRTVRFNLKEVDPTFVRALVNLKIVNGKLLTANKAEGQYGEFGDYGVKYLQNKDAGSGPYAIADFRAGEGITLKAFEGYKLRPWEPGAPTEVRLRIIPEIVTLENKMLAGEFDVSLVSPSPPRVKIFADNPKLAVDSWPTLNNYYVVMNTKKPPLDDENVRKAISHAFDAGTVMNKIYSGGIHLQGPVPEALLGKCEGIPTYEFDMKKAAAYLAKSKYSADDLKKNWFSDGGICSNFPIHFFDHWLPTRPTFGISLGSMPSDQVSTVRKPLDGIAGATEVEPRRSEPVHLPQANRPEAAAWHEVSTVAQLFTSMFDTMMAYRDTMQSELPGFRERIVEIRLTNDEGGLNLDMDPKRIQRLADKGAKAGELLRAFNFDEHRWVRLQVLMPPLAEELEHLLLQTTTLGGWPQANHPYHRGASWLNAMQTCLTALAATTTSNALGPLKLSDPKPPSTLRASPKI